MKLGFSSMNTPEDERPDVLARALEERGYESFWIGEHPHIPVDRRTPYPAGGEMPDQYKRMMDPFVSLTAAAAATESLVVGTSVALPLEHDLFALAKAVATLDHLSGGRFEFGVGVGWNEEELANHRPDIPWKQRYRALAECVEALRTLWTEDEARFQGRFFAFDAVWSFPKPVTTPHPRLLCGMAGRLGTEHAVAWADGWLPMDVALGDVAKRVARFREAGAAAGRADVPISMVTWGDPTLDTLKGYRDLGIERVLLGPARDGWADPAS
ncbi:MAG: TIGR03619 family F420-dependent LLM class oxidoreductase, partial [Actinomycetota bacterium]|nr:TIGR03619 family F420-dependent LLM class oxidoreductase [Actinomycetota bacterium]